MHELRRLLFRALTICENKSAIPLHNDRIPIEGARVQSWLAYIKQPLRIDYCQFIQPGFLQGLRNLDMRRDLHVFRRNRDVPDRSSL